MNKKVLIFSGPTREAIDPVRYLSNASSGKMGKALAEKADTLGHEVTFISGPVEEANLPKGKRIHLVRVLSAQNMLEEGLKYFSETDVAIFAAAVADYAPKNFNPVKTVSGINDLSLPLKPNPDIAATLGTFKKPHQKTLGFALETEFLPNKIQKKMKNKNLDAILYNTPESLGSDTGEYTLWTSDHLSPEPWGLLNKKFVAEKIFEFLAL